jgi:CRP-like cAMP-binding protein
MTRPSKVDPADIERCRTLIRTHFLLRDADPALIESLVSMASIMTLQAGTELFAKGDRGDGLYGVLSGRMRIFVSGIDGDDVVLNLLGPGELFGEIAMIDDEPRSASAAATEETRLMRLRRDRFVPFLRQNADVGLGLLQVLCRRIRAISERTEDQILLPLPARLAKRMVAVGEPPEAPLPGAKKTLEIRLSQRDLGNLVGSTRESVNRVLTTWRARGIVATDGRKLIILRPDALAAIARFD